MKRIKAVLSLFLSLIIVLSMFTVSFGKNDYSIDKEYYKNNPWRGTVLNVYNWGEYISDGSEGSMDVNSEFEKLTGIKVNYTNFDSNESLYSKLKSGGAQYDVIIPSDYMIERLKNEDMLLPLDYSKIPNYKYIDPDYKNLFYDPENLYTVPYNVGYVALIYNKKLVDSVPDSWNALWDSKYAGRILMFNNPRDSFAIAQSILGENYNTLKKEDWNKAKELLMEQKPLVRSYVMDEVFNIMESGSAALAPYYVGDFFTMQENNPDLALAFPKEGANIFVDAMCIPKTAQNKGAAELYINFMEEPEVALANAETICYATPNMAVREMDDYSFKDNPYLYPEKDKLKHYQYFHYLDQKTQNLMSSYWNEVKVAGISNRETYIGLGVFFGVFIVFFVAKKIKLKNRAKYYK